MWILPKSLQSAFSAEPQGSTSEPSTLASSLEASFTWRGKPSLVAQARKQWPTPDASVSTGYNQSASSGASIRYSLAGKVTKQWPTTTVGDGDKYSVKTNPNSQAAKSLHPTSLDLSSLLDPKMKSRGEESSSQGRTLNPRFVEWLMGWPIGWTDCDSLVTEWFLLKPLKL